MVGPVELIEIDTPLGPGRAFVNPAVDSAQSLLVLGHGAGGSLDAVDLAALAQRLPAHGITVVRFEQPWKTAGRKVSAPAKQLDAAWIAAVQQIQAEVGELPLVVGGRSQGARVACRCASETGALGVVALAFPLHPPGRPDASRLPELLAVDVARLVVQGGRDTFGTATALHAELTSAAAERGIEVIEVPGADHSMRTRKRDPLDQASVAELITESVHVFIARVTGQVNGVPGVSSRRHAPKR